MALPRRRSRRRYARSLRKASPIRRRARLSVSVIGLCLAAVGPAPRVEVVDMIDDIAAVAAEGRPATLRPQPLEMAGREAEIMSGLACVQEWAGPARTHSFVFQDRKSTRLNSSH